MHHSNTAKAAAADVVNLLPHPLQNKVGMQNPAAAAADGGGNEEQKRSFAAHFAAMDETEELYSVDFYQMYVLLNAVDFPKIVEFHQRQMEKHALKRKKKEKEKEKLMDLIPCCHKEV